MTFIAASESANCVRLEALLLASPVLGPIIHGWSAIALPGAWLVAGALAQTVWNDLFGFAPEYGLKDVDIVYFDSVDLSEAGEKRHKQVFGIIFRAALPALT